MIEIRNLTKTAVSENFLLKAGNMVLDGERYPQAHISVALVEPPIIQYLNKKYRLKNGVTDVLAFSQKDVSVFEPSESLPVGHLGELAICLEQVGKNARDYKLPFIKELIKIFIHGILHLLGYEHEKTEACRKDMLDKEKRYLAEFFSTL